MAKKNKRLLIVDDSEIDRVVLCNILENDFEIIEAENGYEALEIIMDEQHYLSAILLDVSMPVLDGFDVLRLMNENKVRNIPVFLITAEATKANVEKAAQYNITEFVRKPFDSAEILRRLKTKLKIFFEADEEELVNIAVLTDEDISETEKYIANLEHIYGNYLKNDAEEATRCKRVSELIKILLWQYSRSAKGMGLTSANVEIISKAAFLCNIGQMAVPGDIVKARTRNEADELAYQNHTLLGADIVNLNHSENCRYFLHICSDLCMHHHERYDGKGYPHRLAKDQLSDFAQMYRLLEEFDSLFFRYKEHNDLQFDFVMKELKWDSGSVRTDIFELLNSCKNAVINFYLTPAAYAE